MFMIKAFLITLGLLIAAAIFTAIIVAACGVSEEKHIEYEELEERIM